MQTPIERVMQTYGMMVTLTAEQEEAVRERLQKFLENRTGTDQELAVQGLKFLRGSQGPEPRITNRWGRRVLKRS